MTTSTPPRDPHDHRREATAVQLSWLRRELADWQAAGIVDTEQAAAISGRYRTVAETRRFSLGRLLLALGALFVGVGLIWLVAANLDQLPPLLRFVVVAAFWLAFLVGGELAAPRLTPAVLGALRLLAALTFGATIFQAAQSMQVPAYEPVLLGLWSAGTLLHAYLTRAVTAPRSSASPPASSGGSGSPWPHAGSGAGRRAHARHGVGAGGLAGRRCTTAPRRGPLRLRLQLAHRRLRTGHGHALRRGHPLHDHRRVRVEPVARARPGRRRGRRGRRRRPRPRHRPLGAARGARRPRLLGPHGPVGHRDRHLVGRPRRLGARRGRRRGVRRRGGRPRRARDPARQPRRSP